MTTVKAEPVEGEAYIVTSFCPFEKLGGRIELARKVRELRRAGVRMVYRKHYPGPHRFMCVVDLFGYVTLWLEQPRRNQ